MLESVFFITLGISCVLLIMLIYHFKQRLNKLEQNGNTMFEIINNLAQEITTVNNNFRAISNVPQTPMQPNITHSKINVSLSDDEDNNLTLEEAYIDNEVNTNESCSDEESGSDNDDEESGSDNDDEESGSDNDDEESGSDNDDEESGSDDDHHESGSDNDDEESGSDNDEENSDNDNSDIANILEEEADVKVVNVNLNDNLDSIETPNNEVETDDGNLEQVELNTDEIENILVSKLDETNDLEENDNSTPASVNTGAVYKKMNVYSLKALVIEKGLSSDPSALKKKELINLLKSND